MGCISVRWLFGDSMGGLLLISFVPLCFSFLAELSLFCFLCVPLFTYVAWLIHAMRQKKSNTENQAIGNRF